MKIRSITSFVDPGWPVDAALLDRTAENSTQAQAAFEQAGYEVQTTRLATTPFPSLLKNAEKKTAVELAQALEVAATERGFGYISLGPALLDAPDCFELIPAMLAATQAAFFGAVMADKEHGVSLPAIRACAEIIRQAARLEEHGFANLRCAALANVPAGSPFFPAAYHAGGPPAFAIAPQAADLAVTAFEDAASVAEASQQLTTSLNEHSARLADIGRKLEKENGLRFSGIDFSMAPFPQEAESLGTAFERLGLPAVGLHGSLAVAAILTDAIQAADFPRVGFNGLLMTPLEDATLARRAAEGRLSVQDLLMYSAVCGTGLDTIPLPGDSRVEQLSALLLDVASLALRLDKPLTARLMPIPGKAAGDETSFDFEFFVNSRVMALDAEALSGPLATDEVFRLRGRA